jgi:hopanoid C-2 methylase
MLFKICWKLGVIADFRQQFWTFAWPRLKSGKIENVISIGILTKHLITFARKAASGALNASHYSTKLR